MLSVWEKLFQIEISFKKYENRGNGPFQKTSTWKFQVLRKMLQTAQCFKNFIAFVGKWNFETKSKLNLKNSIRQRACWKTLISNESRSLRFLLRTSDPEKFWQRPKVLKAIDFLSGEIVFHPSRIGNLLFHSEKEIQRLKIRFKQYQHF